MPVPDGGLLVLDFIREDYRIEDWPITPSGRAVSVAAELRHRIVAQEKSQTVTIEAEE